MELKFEKMPIHCLRPVLQEVQNSEQTQEIRLSDGMPDIGRVVGAWGQSILRSKEWHTDQIACSAGMMIWVLYAPEGEGEHQVLSSWVPFPFRWELPDGVAEGDIRLSLLTRFVDARSVSPRKIMVRCGMAALAEALVPDQIYGSGAAEAIPGVELLKNRYPVKLRKEAGEKTFLLDEVLSVPDSAPVPEKIVYGTVDGKLQDCRVLADKLAFRGAGRLHILYCSESGQVHSWDFELPFSQYAQLGDVYGNDAQGDIRFVVTNLEQELTEDGKLRLKCGMAAQYVICDRDMAETVEDAYGIGQELQLQQENMEIPAILESTRENLYGEQTISANANLAADVRFLPDFPVQRRMGEMSELTFPGSFQLLYYGEDGLLRGASAKWEGLESVRISPEGMLCIYPQAAETQAMVGNGSITVKMELPTERMVSAVQGIPTLTQIQTGQPVPVDPGRPSLILQRAGTDTLWNIAKKNGSTVASIRAVNGLEGEPAPGQMLLIPVV